MADTVTNSQGFFASLGSVFQALRTNQQPPADYQWRSQQRAILEREIHSSSDEYSYGQTVRSVNYALDQRNIPLNAHSTRELSSNVAAVANGQPMSLAHVREAMTFMQGRNAHGNNYGSCVAGVLLHTASATLWRQIEEARPD